MLPWPVQLGHWGWASWRRRGTRPITRSSFHPEHGASQEVTSTTKGVARRSTIGPFAPGRERTGHVRRGPACRPGAIAAGSYATAGMISSATHWVCSKY